MIHSFSCKNFYSFADLTSVDFTVNDKAPTNNGYFVAPSGVRLSNVETVIGANASGKTNFLKVLPFLKWLIADSFNTRTELLPIKSFMFGANKKKPTELSVNFEIDGNIYIYSFILDESKIISEELKVKNKSKEKLTSKKIFSRQWDDENKKYKFDDKNLNVPKEFENFLRTNTSIIASATLYNHKLSLEILNFWKKIETNVVEAGWVGDHLTSSASKQLVRALEFYGNETNKKIKEKAEKLLSRFDLGLDTFDITKEMVDNEFRIKEVRVSHSFGGSKEYLPIQYESSGTKQLFVLLKTILLVLNNGGVAVLDEFDVNLHPEMVLALFDLFIQPETNPNNAQLLFSTHSHQILSKLDKYQIILTEKNENGASESWRLDEMAGVRADDNYYSKYMAGAYGAVPKL